MILLHLKCKCGAEITYKGEQNKVYRRALADGWKRIYKSKWYQTCGGCYEKERLA